MSNISWPEAFVIIAVIVGLVIVWVYWLSLKGDFLNTLAKHHNSLSKLDHDLERLRWRVDELEKGPKK